MSEKRHDHEPTELFRDCLGGKLLRRDMNLIRELLLRIEEAPTKPSSGVFLVPNDEVESTRILEHLKLVEEEGLIKGMPMDIQGIHLLHDIELTWRGHDFLDAVRDPQIWQETKTAAQEAGGWTVDLLKELANGFLKKQIEARTGVKL
jgi:hypothetical protein